MTDLNVFFDHYESFVVEVGSHQLERLLGEQAVDAIDGRVLASSVSFEGIGFVLTVRHREGEEEEECDQFVDHWTIIGLSLDSLWKRIQFNDSATQMPSDAIHSNPYITRCFPLSSLC